MSAKLLRTMTDDNQDLQKQIGCMNGFFQLFDRRHFLAGRRINSHDHKRLLSGQNGSPAREPDSTLQRVKETNPKNLVKERHRVSTESSKTSLSSSSCSSSFSSLDYKIAQFESSSYNQPSFPETPTRPMNKPNASLQSRQQSHDLRDVVKDSIYREARILSVKTCRKEEAVGSTLKYIDSPRPLQLPNSIKPRASSANDSVCVLAKLQESRNYKEEKASLKLLSLKEAPRLSYDGRVSQDASKSTIKLKELPRLSLDSRVCSIRGSASETKSNFLLKDLQRRSENSSNMLNQQQEPESSKRSSTIIAKLMGLEAFQQSPLTNENPLGFISNCQTEKSDHFSNSRTTDGNKQNQIPRSPRKSHKDPIQARLKNDDHVIRPTSGSRFPAEPTPRRQPDGNQSSQQTSFGHGKVTTKASNSCPSVYGEIEKRLAELEFNKSGKDLRALKQILEAMQKPKEALDTKREQASEFASQRSNYGNSLQSSNLASPRKLQNKDPISDTIKGSHSPKSYRPPTAVMKPVKVIRRTSDCASNIIPIERMSRPNKHADTANGRKVDTLRAKDLAPGSNYLKDHFSSLSCSTDKKTNARTSKSTSALTAPRHIIGENNMTSATVSPRLQQRKLRSQKQSPPTIPSLDSSNAIRQPTRQPMGSNSPSRKLKLRSPSLQQCNDQLSETSSGMRDLSHQGDTISLQSESNISLCSDIDMEILRTNQSDKINTTFSQQDGKKQKNPTGCIEDRLIVEPSIATLEQPSPVSVLDATFYRDESPSPVKKILNAFEDYEAQDPDEGEWVPSDLAQFPKGTKPSFSAYIDDNKSESIRLVLQNLQQINYTEENPITDYTTALHESMNSDHRYISEILLASGLLRDLDFDSMTIQLQALGHAIDPEVFLALEQTEASAGLLNDKLSGKKIVKSEHSEKIQRILVFDTVNEIFAQKLLLGGPLGKWFSPNKLAGRKPRGQQLLEEMCSAVDQLQNNHLNRSLDEGDDSLRSIISEDLMQQSMDWIDCPCEIPSIVLDLERLIFKDLITEFVNWERVGLKGRPGRRSRKLFSM
ncbi:hypothetical protein I3842_03G083800 [Carya illinoinensis]|uniref:DUF4378 domain-containing protein n=2 Tax=Carya illinoinensis TaxID=32201 RepID=A0A922FIK3_CARIL|nr:hypothetical protein I3842_03G083800 [Carya illinoinensis]KAG6720857.1 hypothetical protein I3842_03G083800 [Carya illinoinensis]KAG6720858.1 hypothetical protein I3842_03G083800 [Carya illinoinensis]